MRDGWSHIKTTEKVIWSNDIRKKGHVVNWKYQRTTPQRAYSVSDANQNTVSKDPIQISIEPVTRARAKKFKDALNMLIQGVWAQAKSWVPIEHGLCDLQRCIIMVQVLEESGQSQA